jgi:Rrf2 family protein
MDTASGIRVQEHDMKLSKRGEYALRALIDLGIASELGWPMLQISELASKEKLPIKFLEQIFTQLKAAGYVKSRRGKFGGYSLARPMSGIKFGAVVRLIDGPLAPIRCVSQTSYARCSCPDEIHCGLRMLMFDVRNAITAVLDRFTLADIVEITLRKYRRDKVAPPFLHRSIPLASILSREGEPTIPGKSRVEALKKLSGSRGSPSQNGRPKTAAK